MSINYSLESALLYRSRGLTNSKDIEKYDKELIKNSKKIYKAIALNNIKKLFEYECDCQVFDANISGKLEQSRMYINSLTETEIYSEKCKEKAAYLNLTNKSSNKLGKPSNPIIDDKVTAPLKKINRSISHDTGNRPTMGEISLYKARKCAMLHIINEHNKTVNRHLGFEPKTQKNTLDRS